MCSIYHLKCITLSLCLSSPRITMWNPHLLPFPCLQYFQTYFTSSWLLSLMLCSSRASSAHNILNATIKGEFSYFRPIQVSNLISSAVRVKQDRCRKIDSWFVVSVIMCQQHFSEHAVHYSIRFFIFFFFFYHHAIVISLKIVHVPVTWGHLLIKACNHFRNLLLSA